MKLVFVQGATATGKSQLAQDLALANSRTAIFNCDSIQMYANFNIGSAKPSSDDLKKIPHYLYSVIDYPSEATAGVYRKIFLEQLEKIKNQYECVFVVGGTGFYFQAIEKGMFAIGPASEELKKQVEQELSQDGGPERLMQELETRDPVTAKRFSVNDHYRLGRAIEIMRTHNRTVTQIREEQQQAPSQLPYPLLKLGVSQNKEQLLPKVQSRTQKMLQQGLVEEVRDLLKRYPPTWTPFSSIGYREVVGFLKDSGIDLHAEIVQSTMQLAKKQRTWFRRDLEVQWVAPTEVGKAKTIVEEFLSS